MPSDLKIDNSRLTWRCNRCGTVYEVWLTPADRALLAKTTIHTLQCKHNGLLLFGTVLETAA